MQALVYTPAMQGNGEFDGGRITEQKPIGFPGEGAVVKRVGPLFYWAWGYASEEASIGLHPHQGFEIMTYVLEGNAFHGDTLGTKSTVVAGGVQVMQTGSGVSHQEKVGANTELLQIWVEPDLTEAVKRVPTYRQHEHEDFPLDAQDAYQLKTVIGSGSPVELVTDIRMWDLELNNGSTYKHPIAAGYTLTALAIRGQGTWTETGAAKHPVDFHHKDFIIGAAAEDSEFGITSKGEGKLRLILIEVPTHVSYPLYHKR